MLVDTLVFRTNTPHTPGRETTTIIIRRCGENHARFVERLHPKSEVSKTTTTPKSLSRTQRRQVVQKRKPDEDDDGFGKTIAPQLDWLGTVKHGGQSLPIRHRKAEPPAGGPPGQRWVASDRPDRNSRTRTVPRTPKARSGGAMPSRDSCRKINRFTEPPIDCFCWAPVNPASQQSSNK